LYYPEQVLQTGSSRLPLGVSVVTGGLGLGGSTTFLCNFAGELVRRNIPTEIVSFESHHPLASDFERLNVPVRRQDERRIIFEDRLHAILEALGRSKPAVVVANLSAMSFEVLRYLPPGVFRVGVAHSDDPGVYNMVRRYAGQLNLMAAVSETIKRRLETMPEFAGVPVKYLPLGVPMPAAVAPREFNGPLRILYLGRLGREQKRVHLFPEILAGLKSAGIPFHWTIVGEGPEAAWLKETMKTRTPGDMPDPSDAVQTVSIRGSISYAEVPRLLAGYEVFLLASDYEGLPLTLLEAMGSGLVPVVSDLPSGIRELVDEHTGKRVAPDNVAGYAQAILWLHAHRGEMARLSANAREKVFREYSVGAMTDRWLDAFPKSPATPDWPTRWTIQPPLGSSTSFRFSRPGKALRRLKFKLRGGFESSP
jgi:glycosyltransferase involved in cell wall biosynthesis